MLMWITEQGQLIDIHNCEQRWPDPLLYQTCGWDNVHWEGGHPKGTGLVAFIFVLRQVGMPPGNGHDPEHGMAQG